MVNMYITASFNKFFLYSGHGDIRWHAGCVPAGYGKNSDYRKNHFWHRKTYNRGADNSIPHRLPG